MGIIEDTTRCNTGESLISLNQFVNVLCVMKQVNLKKPLSVAFKLCGFLIVLDGKMHTYFLLGCLFLKARFLSSREEFSLFGSFSRRDQMGVG